MTKGTRLLAEIRKRPQCPYSVAMRTFAMTLRFHSTIGYEFVRATFDNALPASCTIRNWYASSNCAPGHMQEAYDFLKRIASEKNYQVGISMDEMSIRQQVQHIRAENRFEGYVTYGSGENENGEPEIATKALVFLVQCLDEPFELPVSYFFVQSLKKEELAAMLKEVIEMVTETGVTLRRVTSDGDPKNIAAFKYLGASFEFFKPFIISEKQPDIKI